MGGWVMGKTGWDVAGMGKTSQQAIGKPGTHDAGRHP